MNTHSTELKVRASGYRSEPRRLIWMVVLLLAGCASGPGANPHDPLEPMNRDVYRFNEAVDSMFLKPVATAYNNGIPRPVRTGVNNFFNNLSDVWSLVNNALQAKPKDAVETFFRVSVNTLMGLGGLLDVASEMGLEPHREDFGQTLGRWGVPTGPYLVLPILGPSTLRDAASLRADTLGSPVYNVDHVRTRNGLLLLDAIDTRAGLVRAGLVLDEAALDKYSFSRDVYLQKRRNDVYDGSPPEEVEPAVPDAPASGS
jgi:phospholipid-binding lipoprotein MlaA